MTGTTSLPAIANATAVHGGNGALQQDFLIMPFGTPIFTRNAAEHNLRDRAHADRVLAATKAALASAQMSIDYDHQTFTAANTQVGGTAKASGWVKDLEIRDDGIWALGVKWTSLAATALASQEYRYISPYYKYDPTTGDVTRIVNLGITNLPNFDMAAIAAEHSHNNQGSFCMKKIAVALGLAEDATEEQILTMIADWKSAQSVASEMQTALITVFGLSADADAGAIASAAKTAKDKADQPAVAAEGEIDLSKYVPRAEFDAVASQVNSREEADAVAMVEKGIADGKLLPAQKAFWMTQAKADKAAVASYLEGAPAILKDVDFDNLDNKTATGLAADEAAVASQLGLTEDQFSAAQTNNEGAAK
ncbi:phage protease [Sphingorhabdus sp. 109]|uniref:phage protease n=1 Tax=Sphingorhabdus sp. 109 TaxID=2653173 RepID=UPI0012F43732|nr:phage protease [Sphingorhabdus sp. 109]VWX62576.1 putative Phage I-like protein [Sphingorhabdus sp. 109]